MDNNNVGTPTPQNTAENMSATPLPTQEAAITPTITLQPEPTATPTATPTPTPLVFLEREDIVYKALSFTDSIELYQTEGTGWLIDFDGDGLEERLYAAPDGIYINELRVKSQDVIESLRYNSEGYEFWLLDIDLEDNYIELMTYYALSYELCHYTLEQGLITVTNDACAYFSTDSSFEDAVDIRRPVRIDAHTIAFHDGHGVFDFYFLNASYQLDENHHFAVVQQEYEIINSMPIAYINTEKKLRLYAERNLSGDYFEVDGPQVYMLTKSDAVSWVYLSNRSGISGWIYYENIPNIGGEINHSQVRSDFVGYSTVP